MTQPDPKAFEATQVSRAHHREPTHRVGAAVASEERTEVAAVPTAAGDKDPIRVLLSFHHRIRLAFNTLSRVSRQARKAINPLEVAALYDFFSTELAAHDLDEEASLLNRLARVEHPDRLDKLLAACRKQHEHLETAIESCLPHLQAVAERRILPDPLRLSEVREDLQRVLEPHLRLEEQEIFPMAQLLLAPEELEAIYDEMIARRRRREGNQRTAFALS